MSEIIRYEKQLFYSGQLLQASHLDKMEDGIVNAEKLAIAAADFGPNLLEGTAIGSIQQKGYDNVPGAVASGKGAVAFGGQRFDKAGEDPAEEPITEAKGEQSFAAGGGVIVDGAWSAGFGKDTKTYQRACFAAGGGTQSGMTYGEWLVANSKEDTEDNFAAYQKDYGFAVAFGDSTKALGRASVSLGEGTVANARNSLSMGRTCITNGEQSLAGGWNTQVNGNYSLGFGAQLLVNGECQSVVGQYNRETTGAWFIVGDGSSVDERSNAFEIRTNGDIWMTYGGKTYSLVKIFANAGYFNTKNEISE